jgi:hypothetical protein
MEEKSKAKTKEKSKKSKERNKIRWNAVGSRASSL